MEDDPLQDIIATERVALVINDGEVVFDGRVSATASPTASDTRDFVATPPPTRYHEEPGNIRDPSDARGRHDGR